MLQVNKTKNRKSSLKNTNGNKSVGIARHSGSSYIKEKTKSRYFDGKNNKLYKPNNKDKKFAGIFGQVNGKPDYFLLFILFSILSFGLLMVYEASVVYSDNVFGGKYHFLVQQLGWVTLGLIGMYTISRIDLTLLKKISPYIFIISLFFLFIVLLPTIFAPEIYGARRWIVINPKPFPEIPFLGRLNFQPSELLKLTCIIFIAAVMSNKNFKQYIREPIVERLFTAITIFIIMLVPVFLVILQPDFTTAAIIFSITLSLLFIGNIPLVFFIVTVPISLIGGVIYALSSAYRRARVETLLNPSGVDASSTGYHIKQVMIALGSGGFWGLGLGKSRQKYAYLPEVTADSIFAVVGEELGFIGAVFLITLFVALIFRCVKIANSSNDNFSKLLVMGVVIWFSTQALINLLAMVRIFPLTGVPLPLISYGGSATIFLLLGFGLILNVSRNNIDNINEKKN